MTIPSNWVDVSDRYPTAANENEFFLCQSAATSDILIRRWIASPDSYPECWEWAGEDLATLQITSWQPIPKPRADASGAVVGS